MRPRPAKQLRAEVDEVICAITPEPFYAVGLWYEDFSQTTDEEVRDLLGAATAAAEAEARRDAEEHMQPTTDTDGGGARRAPTR